MPAIITPPDLERRPRRSEENDGGHGRRPPNGRDLKRTGGGGDNDNGNQSGPERRPGERLTMYRLGLLFALGAVFMFFVGIVSLFFHSQSSGHFDAYNRYIFAKNFDPTEVRLIFAGPGTFWTDLKTFEQVGASKLIQQQQQSK